MVKDADAAGSPRESQRRAGAGGLGRVEGDGAAVEFGGFLDQGEAESGALAAGLELAQGEEALEDLLAGVVGDAGAAVLDGEDDGLVDRQPDSHGFAAR